MLFKRKPKGRIRQPKNDGIVPRHFRAKGTVSHLPDDQHLWIVVQVEGLMWPKGDVAVTDGAWSTEVYEEGRLTDSYPGLRRIEGGVRLDRIRLRLKSR